MALRRCFLSLSQTTRVKATTRCGIIQRRQRLTSLVGDYHSSSLFLLDTNNNIQQRSSFSTTTTTPRQQQKDDDHFTILGIHQRYDINLQQMKTLYRRLMSELHPDRHTMKSTQQQDEISQLASKVTNAYSVLQDPCQRAIYLLELLGRPINQEETTTGFNNNNNDSAALLSGEFLLDIMERREHIEQTNLDSELKELLIENTKEMNQISNALALAFSNNDLDKAMELTAKLQYFGRIEQTIRDKVDDLS